MLSTTKFSIGVFHAHGALIAVHGKMPFPYSTFGFSRTGFPVASASA